MHRARTLLKRIRSTLRPSRADRELDHELDFHLRMEIDRNIRDGMDPTQATRTALLAFGGVERFKEDVRDARSFAWLEDLRLDLRHAARSLRRNPAFALITVITLALGTGANTAVFSVVHGVLLAPLPYTEPDRIVRVWETNTAENVERGSVSPGTFVDLRSQSRTLEAVAIHRASDRLLSFGDVIEEVRGASVSPALFDLLGVRPVLGRTFRPEELQEPPFGDLGEVVIGHDLWQRHFGGRQDVIGATIRAEDGDPLTVIGVMPANFDFPGGARVWSNEVFLRPVGRVQRQFRYYAAIARVGEANSLESARSEASAIASRLEADHPASNAGWGMHLERLDESIVGGSRAMLLVLLGVAGCVLLIACGNVANLIVARATARRHEIAVRTALGAGRLRLLRQWLTEGLLLGVLGGAVGIALAFWSTRAFVALAPADVPRLDEIGFSGPVLLFAIGAACVCAIVAGAAPAFQFTTPDITGALKGGRLAADPGQARVREWLVGAEVALTLVLLVGAALLLRSFVLLRGVDLGFRPENVLTAELRIPSGRFAESRPWYRLAVHYEQLIDDLGGVPGIGSVAGVTTLPLSSEPLARNLWRRDAPGATGSRPPTSAADQWQADMWSVTPEYFSTMGIPIVRGRGFHAGDRTPEEPLIDPSVPRPPGVAVINQAMSDRYFAGEDPLGQEIVLFDDSWMASHRTIVGVVGDVRAHGVADAAAPAVYLPHAQHPRFGLSLVIRPDVPPEQVRGMVAERLRAFDPRISVSNVRPLSALVSGAVARPRFNLALVGSFALLALSLAAVGIYGVVRYLVTRRTREIGIRIALGAHRRDVLRLVLADGMRPVLIGAVAGGLGAVALARAMQSLLYGLAPADPASFGIGMIVLAAAACAAALIPARRATRVDPVVALQSE